MNHLYERQHSSERALEIAESTLIKWNLDVEFSFYGHQLKTYQCKLFDSKNNTLFFGCGKGIGIQSKVSACFEALEHYAVHAFCQNTPPESYDSLDNPLIASMRIDKA